MNQRLLPGEADVVLHALPLAGTPARPEWLSEAERRRADRFVTPSLRQEFIARRTALREFAARMAGVDPAALRPGYHCPDHGRGSHLDHGQPGYTLSGRETPLPLALSSSSAEGWLLLAGAADTPDHPRRGNLRLGVDLESIERVDFEGFDEAVLSAAECATLESLPRRQHARYRASCWAAKEAVSKARGIGLRIDPRQVSCSGATMLDTAWLGLPEGFIAALAVLTSRTVSSSGP